jgi:hypothetical protein
MEQPVYQRLLDHVTELASTGPFGVVAVFISFAVIALIFYTAIGMPLSFLYHQIKNLVALYSHSKEYELEVHPYTHSILNNTCPELKELARLKKLGKTSEMKDILRDMISTVKSKETNKEVRTEIVKSLQSLV